MIERQGEHRLVINAQPRRRSVRSYGLLGVVSFLVALPVAAQMPGIPSRVVLLLLASLPWVFALSIARSRTFTLDREKGSVEGWGGRRTLTGVVAIYVWPRWKNRQLRRLVGHQAENPPRFLHERALTSRREETY